MKPKYEIITLSTLFILFFGMCRQGKINESAFTDAANFDSVAATNYQNYCAGCHGDNMEEFSDRKWMFANTDSEIENIIRQGDENMGMPGFDKALTDNEIAALTQHILAESKKKQALKRTDIFSGKKIQGEKAKYWTEVVVDNLEVPWGLEFLPNGDLLIAERKGTLSRFTKDNKLVEIKGLPPILVGGQGGLMELKLHPKYEENRWIYIAYSYIDEEDKDAGNTAIIRAKLNGDSLINMEPIYKGIPAVTTRHHYGVRIAFDREGYMYFSIGDRGRREVFPQSLNNSNGKIHRTFDDGTIPPDNPFVDVAGAIKSIYSYGHRNPQGLSMHPETGDIWESEHGPKGGDEINIVQKGQNYGWPVISFGINYDGTIFTNDTSKEGMMQPIHYYVPSIAPCGQTFVTSKRYKGWENNLLIGSLRFKYLERVVIENDRVVEQERLLEEIGRVRNVRVSPDGYIYVAIEQPGKILKIIPVENK
ncbi:MAG: PQQ-dependent sugar dehydrogenase [Bacteroidales bacterium]|nr:PQQ-dependent sugar dehydrogenase [Bacteroidales bacterium]MBN2820232.1 PQQ-dependent sugar dehydrogenase [Bacteroidales bacterium]